MQLPNLSERSINDCWHYTAINSRLGEIVGVRLPAVLPFFDKTEIDELIDIRVEPSGTKSEAEIYLRDSQTTPREIVNGTKEHILSR